MCSVCSVQNIFTVQVKSGSFSQQLFSVIFLPQLKDISKILNTLLTKVTLQLAIHCTLCTLAGMLAAATTAVKLGRLASAF